jgi:hypothetical protein
MLPTVNAPAIFTINDLTNANPELQSFISRANPTERQALLQLLCQVFEAGQENADERTGRFVARVVSPMLGMPAGIDSQPQLAEPRRRQAVRAAVRLLSGFATSVRGDSSSHRDAK